MYSGFLRFSGQYKQLYTIKPVSWCDLVWLGLGTKATCLGLGQDDLN